MSLAKEVTDGPDTEIRFEDEEDQIGKPGAAARSWGARRAVEGACGSSLKVGWRREHGLERAGVLWLREAS